MDIVSRGDFIQQLDVEVQSGKHFTIEGKFPVIRARWRNWPWLRVSYFDTVAGSPKSVTVGRKQRLRWWKADNTRRLKNAIWPEPDWIPVKVQSYTPGVQAVERCDVTPRSPKIQPAGNG